MRWNEMHSWDWPWMVVMMALFWGVVAVVVVTDTRRRRVDINADDTPADEVLRRRLARGEIDVIEFQERLDALHGAKQ